MADLDIAQPHFRQHRHLVADRGHGLEEFQRVFHRHVQHIGDALALELHFQRFAVIACALALFAGDIDIRQEVHLDFDQPITAARLAPPALDVEAEAAWLIPARAAFREPCKPIPDVGKSPGVSGWIGTRRAANGGLVNIDHLVEILQPFDLFMLARNNPRAIERPRGGGVERIDCEARFARAADARDASEGPKRD